MKNLHLYRVSDANIAAVYGKLMKLLNGSTTRIDEITSLKIIDGVHFFKKRDFSSACIEIGWYALTPNTINIYSGDIVEFKGSRTVIIKYKNKGVPQKITFYVVAKKA